LIFGFNNSDRLGYIYFNDLLYASSKLLYQSTQKKDTPDDPLAIREIKKQQQKTIMKLELKKRSRVKCIKDSSTASIVFIKYFRESS
jgi:hypothetical protein